MGLAFVVLFLIVFVVPLIVSGLLILFLAKTVFRDRPWRWPVATGLVLVASSVPWAVDQWELRQDLAAYASDTIFPDSLELEPGRLWHLETSNTAGLTCAYRCDFTELGFVTGADRQEVTYALQMGATIPTISQHDLWGGLEGVTREAGARFPYQYAFISLPQYMDYGVPQSGNYRNPRWPLSGHGVHMLVRLPEDGMLDFGTADVVYRRYNVQREMAYPFLWGVASGTAQSPGVLEIFGDLRAISAATGSDRGD